MALYYLNYLYSYDGFDTILPWKRPYKYHAGYSKISNAAAEAAWHIVLMA